MKPVQSGKQRCEFKKGLEAGFFLYLTKPIEANEFMDTLDMGLEFAGDTLRTANKVLRSA